MTLMLVDFLASKVDALAQCFKRLGVPNPWISSGMSNKGGAVCEICGIQGHILIVKVSIKEFSKSMPFEASTHDSKTTPTSIFTT